MRGLVRWSGKWWPGTIPLVILWVFAAWSSTGPLEAELANRSTAALKDILLDKRKITVGGRDVTLAADAFSEEGRKGAVAAIDAWADAVLASPDGGEPGGAALIRDAVDALLGVAL